MLGLEDDAVAVALEALWSPRRPIRTPPAPRRCRWPGRCLDGGRARGLLTDVGLIMLSPRTRSANRSSGRPAARGGRLEGLPRGSPPPQRLPGGDVAEEGTRRSAARPPAASVSVTRERYGPALTCAAACPCARARAGDRKQRGASRETARRSRAPWGTPWRWRRPAMKFKTSRCRVVGSRIDPPSGQRYSTSVEQQANSRRCGAADGRMSLAGGRRHAGSHGRRWGTSRTPGPGPQRRA